MARKKYVYRSCGHRECCGETRTEEDRTKPCGVCANAAAWAAHAEEFKKRIELTTVCDKYEERVYNQNYEEI